MIWGPLWPKLSRAVILQKKIYDSNFKEFNFPEKLLQTKFMAINYN